MPRHRLMYGFGGVGFLRVGGLGSGSLRFWGFGFVGCAWRVKEPLKAEFTPKSREQHIREQASAVF